MTCGTRGVSVHALRPALLVRHINSYAASPYWNFTYVKYDLLLLHGVGVSRQKCTKRNTNIGAGAKRNEQLQHKPWKYSGNYVIIDSLPAILCEILGRKFHRSRDIPLNFK